VENANSEMASARFRFPLREQLSRGAQGKLNWQFENRISELGFGTNVNPKFEVRFSCDEDENRSE